MAEILAEPQAGPISDPLRRAIAGSGLSPYGLARQSGVHVTAIIRFARGDDGLSLASADKLSAVLGLEMNRGAAGLRIEADLGGLSGPLRFAIAECGLTPHAIGRKAGLNTSDVRRFARGQRGLLVASADKLAGALGVKAACGAGPRITPRTPPEIAWPRPMAEIIRSAIGSHCVDLTQLARDSGVHEQSLRRFAHFESDLFLGSVDRILAVLGLEVVSEPDGPPHGKLSDAIRRAIAGSKQSVRALSKESGVTVGPIGHFLRREGDMKLATAERLSAFLGIKVVRGSVGRKSDPKSIPDDPIRPIADALRSAITDSGLSFYALAKRSGVSAPTISRFLSGKRGHIGYKSAFKLANALGLDPRPADPPPVAARRCPVELREGSPPVVLGEVFPFHLTSSEQAMIEVFARGFADDRGFSIKELGNIAEIQAPGKALSRMLGKPGYERIASTIHRSGTRPVIWTMVYPGDRD